MVKVKEFNSSIFNSSKTKNSLLHPTIIKKMMEQDQVLQQVFQPELDQDGSYGLKLSSYAFDYHDFYSSITSPEDSSMISSDSYLQTILSSDFSTLSNLDDEISMQANFPMENITTPHLEVEEIEGVSGTALEDVLKWWGESEEMDNISTDVSMEKKGVFGSSFIECSDASMAMNLSMVFPQDDMEVEGQTSLCHLLKAYGEAMEMGQRELANVIVGCINDKASPVGGTIERVAYNLFQSGNQGDYINQESMKVFKEAFKAFYEIFPYGRFCHFAANSAILEAIKSDSRKVHIIDFDMGEGVQWPAVLEALGKIRKDTKLTSIRTNNQSHCFEETKIQILDYASSVGLKLEVQEIMIDDLVREIEGSNEHEFLAFNCMTGLPHMGRTRNRSEVMEFLRIAKKLLSSNKGIITFGDGEDFERTKDCGGYSSFFDNNLTHYQALFDSMERNFPQHLSEARIAMESLFVAPYLSSLSWYQKWENVREEYEFKANIGLMDWRLSKENVKEAKEMVERQSSFKIRVEGQNGNEMVLEWKGTPLVRVSAWR